MIGLVGSFDVFYIMSIILVPRCLQCFFKDVCTNADEQNSVGTVVCRFSLVLPSAHAWALQPSGWSPQLSTKSWATPWVRVSGCTLAKGVGELGSKWQHSMRPKPTNHNNG